MAKNRATYNEYLEYLVLKGYSERCTPSKEYDERIKHELNIIHKAQFESYFLIVWDVINFCRENDIPVGPGRGSVCGSLVTYCLYITDVDPMVWDIPFERFLHLERIAMPDIDMDICQVGREQVVEYIKNKYGKDSVAQIITYGTIQARGAVRVAFRDLDVERTITGKFTTQMIDEAANMVPEGSGADQVVIAEWIEEDQTVDEKQLGKKFKEHILDVGARYSKALKGRVGPTYLLDTILYLEGRRAHGSVHSAGLVIGNAPLIDIGIPLGIRKAGTPVHCEHDMEGAEKVGLLKLDVLGLRAVTTIGLAEKMIQKHTPDFEIKKVPLDDSEVYKLLEQRRVKGVFQLAKGGISNAMKSINPDNFEDIIVLLALYRPGPMTQLESYAKRKLGEEDVDYPHPDLVPVLKKTYGLIVYQEQVMGIAQVMADYTPGEADIFRKAIGKKIPELIREEIDKFKQRAGNKGYDADVVNKVSDQIAYFGRYGFNRGHATGYAFITYWTAYLKCHYPNEFFAASLTGYIGDTAQIAAFGHDAISEGITIVPPHINEAHDGFTVYQGHVVFGFGGIKGLGVANVSDILAERDLDWKREYGRETVERQRQVEGSDVLETYKASIKTVRCVPHIPRSYSGFRDFCQRLPHIPINVKRAMVAAGAFDDGDLRYRAQLYEVADEINKDSKKKVASDIPLPEHFNDELTMLRLEREVLGSYVTKNPLDLYKVGIEAYGALTVGEFDEMPSRCTIAGIVLEIQTKDTKRGEMAWITIENNISGLPRITTFNDVWQDIADLKKDDVVLLGVQKQDHPVFGKQYIAKSGHILRRHRFNAQNITLVIPEIDIEILDNIRERYEGKKGAKLRLLCEVGHGRLALMKTDRYIIPTGHALNEAIEKGWGVRIDLNPNRDLVSFDGVTYRKCKHVRKGSGRNRRAIWEEPIAKLIKTVLSGDAIAEFEQT